MMEQEKGIDFEDDSVQVEDDDMGYTSGKGQEFSHQVLVMRCMIKCLEAGSREMRTGYFNQKADKHGNTIKVYIEDTRKVFIQSVKTAVEMFKCDLDEEAGNEIKSLFESLDKEYNKLCKEELKDFFNAHPIIKKQRSYNGIVHREGTLNKELPYYQDYIDFEVNVYQKLLGVLTLLTKRKDFYAEVIWAG